MKNAAIYTRYSTDLQSKNSTETQVAECRLFAQQNGMNVVSVYSDEAQSGMTTQREALAKLLVAAQNHEFDAVIIYDQSRLSREIVAWFTLRNTLPLYGIELYSASRQQEFGDLHDPNVFLAEGVEAVFNQMHVLISREKSIAGQRNIANKGLFAGGSACLGYDIINREYQVNEDEATAVRLIFSLYADGKSYKYIIDQLNALGIRTKAGRSFGVNSISTILRNERYIGVFTYGKIFKNPDGSRNSHKEAPNHIRIENAVPPVISKELWEQVQNRLNNNKRNAANKATVEYLLSGKIFCGHCKAGMSGEKRKGKYFYYVCNTRKRLHTCEKRGVNKDFIERKVIHILRQLLTEENIVCITDALYESIGQLHDTVSPIRQAAQKELKRVDRQIENITSAIADGLYSPSLGEKMRDLEKQKSEILKSLSELEKKNVSFSMSKEDIKNVLCNARQIGNNDRLLIQLMVDRVYCYDDDTFELILNPLNIPYGGEKTPLEGNRIKLRVKGVRDLSHQKERHAKSVSFFLGSGDLNTRGK